MQEISQPKRPEKPSLILPEALVSQLGQNEVLQRLIRERLPLTAENYIALNWWGEPPEEMDEDELHIIDLLRHHEASQHVKFGTDVAGCRVPEDNDRDAGSPS
jgi:hypothetical protein